MPYNYQHRKDNVNVSGATSSQLTVSAVQLSDAGQYAIQITNNNGGLVRTISLPQAVAVDMLGLPQILEQPEDTAVVVGQSAAFTAEASSQLDDLTWGWQESVNGTTWSSVTGANGSGGMATLVLTTAIADHSKQYRVVFTNTNGSRATFPALLDVVDSPIVGSVRINGMTGTQAVDEGSNAAFSWVHTGDGSSNFDYQWQKSIASVWTDINGATSLEFALTGLETSDAGNYRIGVSFENQLLTHFTIELTVTATVSLPVIATQPTSQSVTVGDPVTFTAAATGADTWLWQVSTDGSSWSAMSGATGSGNSATLTFTPVLDDDGLLYRAEFTNTAGETHTTGASLTVSSVAVLGDVRFGDLTPAGEGEQEIAAADGTYSVGGGSFTVAANRINVVTMPAVGTYAVDGVDVQVVANARTCSTTAEVAYLWRRAAAFHPVGTKILIAPGTYNVFPLLSGNTYLLNDWDWEGLDPDNKPLMTTSATGLISHEPSVGSPGCMIRNINFYREQAPVGRPDNVVRHDLFTIRNDVTNMRFEDCRFYSNIFPVKLGGFCTTKNIGISIYYGCGASMLRCEFDHLCTGWSSGGYVSAVECVQHDIYSDFIQLNAGVTGEIRNGHSYNNIGDGTILHSDFMQLQVPPKSPIPGSFIVEGNTCTPGLFWDLSGGIVDTNKSPASFNTAGPHLLNVTTHHGIRQLFCRVADAGGTMTIQFPPAAGNKFFTVVPYQAGAGVITIELADGDTSDDPLIMNSNNTAYSFVSDGVSHWHRLPPGYRGHTQRRFESQLLGEFEKDLSVYAVASAGSIDLQLPGGTSAYFVNVKKDDTTANLVSVLLPAGQTFTHHGVAGLTANRTIGRCADALEMFRDEGATVWQVQDKGQGQQGFHSNGGDGWDGLIFRNNILFCNSPRGFSPDDRTVLPDGVYVNSKCYNNTFLRMTPGDVNGDGVIANSDGFNTTTPSRIFVYRGIDSFRNVCVGNVIASDTVLRMNENVPLDTVWSDPTDLSALAPYFQVTGPEDWRPVTRQECIDAALAATGGQLIIDADSHSFIGAVGTTATNGPYNWTTGVANLNTKTPLLTSTLPSDDSTDVPTNTTIRLNFDELVTLGTGNISIRTVGGSQIEEFNVATSPQIAFSGDGATLVITPTSNLPATTNVCVRIESTAVKGYFNDFLGIADDSVNFTTASGTTDPELLPDPGFDDPMQWAAGSGSAGSFPRDGWDIAGSLAVKGASTNFRDLKTVAPHIAVIPGIVYRGTATVGTIAVSAGNLNIRFQYRNAGHALLLETNTNTAMSTLTTGSVVSHQSTAPAESAYVVMVIVASSGTAEFTLTDASFRVV